MFGRFIGMSVFFDFLANFDPINPIISIVALIFTLHLWRLDRLYDDESQFVEKKTSIIGVINTSIEEISNCSDEKFLKIVQEVNEILNVILRFRFLSQKNVYKKEYLEICEFYEESKYLINMLVRYKEKKNLGEENNLANTVLWIPYIEEDEMKEIKVDYRNGLIFILWFLRNLD